MAGEAFYLLAGVCAIAILVVFILAIRLSYRIEARSPNLINRSGYSRKAMMLHTITNMKVARDPETLAMLSSTSVAPPQLDEFLLDYDIKLRKAEIEWLGL